jgi:hypothetical protein
MSAKIKLLAVAAISIALTAPAQLQAQELTQYYDARGNSRGISLAAPDGFTSYYDNRGNSVGTSLTFGGATNYYSPRGRFTGTSIGPDMNPSADRPR